MNPMVTTTQKPINAIGTQKLKREEDKHITKKKNHQIIREEIKRRKKEQLGITKTSRKQAKCQQAHIN